MPGITCIAPKAPFDEVTRLPCALRSWLWLSVKAMTGMSRLRTDPPPLGTGAVGFGAPAADAMPALMSPTACFFIRGW